MVYFFDFVARPHLFFFFFFFFFFKKEKKIMFCG